MRRLHLLFYQTIFCLTPCLVLNKDLVRTQFMNDLTDMLSNKTKYDKSYFPMRAKPGPIEINVSMIIYDLRDFSEVAMNFRSDIYLTQKWYDGRFGLSPAYVNLTYSNLHPDNIDLIWKPDTFFPNVIELLDPSTQDSFTHKNVLKIDGKGNVAYSQRLTLTANCPMKLKRFPFDYQQCKLSLRSFTITDTNLIYNWDEQTTTISFINQFMLPQLGMYNYSLATFELYLPENQNFSGLNLCFLLERKTNYYFMQLYIPGALIVFVAWLSSMSENRFQNLLSVLLAQFFLYFSYITVMPKVSEVKLMDIFMAACFVFIFLAMIKTFLVQDKKPSSVVSHDPKKVFHTSTKNVKKKEQELVDVPVHRKQPFLKHLIESVKSHHYCTGSNRVLFIGYPMTFILFCSCYFLICFLFLHDPVELEAC